MDSAESSTEEFQKCDNATVRTRNGGVSDCPTNPNPGRTEPRTNNPPVQVPHDHHATGTRSISNDRQRNNHSDNSYPVGVEHASIAQGGMILPPDWVNHSEGRRSEQSPYSQSHPQQQPPHYHHLHPHPSVMAPFPPVAALARHDHQPQQPWQPPHSQSRKQQPDLVRRPPEPTLSRERRAVDEEVQSCLNEILETVTHRAVQGQVRDRLPEAGETVSQQQKKQQLQEEKQQRRRSSLLEAARLRDAVVVTWDVEQLDEPHRSWVKSLLGREWEIYWKQQDGSLGEEKEGSSDVKMDDAANVPLDPLDNTVKKEEDTMETDAQAPDDDDDDQSDNDSVFEADWYDARIQSFESLRTTTDGDVLLYCNVNFLGDNDSTCEMVVTPHTVRPSARVWIRRTKAILKQQPLHNVDERPPRDWESLLPPDTRSLDDVSLLNAMQRQFAQEFPVTESAKCYRSSDNETFQKLRGEHEYCCRLMHLLQVQLYLRSRLASIDDDDAVVLAGDDSDDDEIDPTESYVNFLVNRLNELDEACRWHYKCWNLVYRIFSAKNDDEADSGCSNQELQSLQLTRKSIIEEYLSPGRVALSTLLSNKDVSIKAAKAGSKGRKRPNPCTTTQDASSPSRSSSRRRSPKRSRKSRTFSESWIALSTVGDYCEEKEEEDLLTSELVERFVVTVCQSDPRLFTVYCGRMLQSISSMIVLPFVRWERKARFFLGESDTLEIKASEGETSAEDVEDDISVSDGEEGRNFGPTDDGCGRMRFVKYEEVEKLVEDAMKSRILQNFALSVYLGKLNLKLRAIDAFEERAWELILRVLDDPETKSGKELTLLDKDGDPTLRELKKLLQEAGLRDGPIENMNPIGRGSSGLNRKALENAMVYRSWFLDLIYAESARERISFIDGVVSRISKLPPLPSRHGSSDQHLNSDISAKLDLVGPRVRALSAKYMDRIALFHRYQSMLDDERAVSSLNKDRKGFMTQEGVREALNELQALGVISVAEEMLGIRIDTLEWETRANNILSQRRPTFDELSALKQAVDMILEGRSQSRAQIVQGKQRHSETESEIKMFAHSDVKGICGALYAKTVALFASASAWKERADAVLSVLRTFGNTCAGQVATYGAKPSTMVDKRRIDDLISEYVELDVDLRDTFCLLKHVRDAAEKWSSNVSATLEDDDLSFEECRTFVERIASERPAGLIVSLTRHVVDLLAELLQWYTDSKKLTSSSAIDEYHLHLQLLIGIQVVERFSQKRKDQSQLVVPSNAVDIISAHINLKTPRPISVSKLESSHLGKVVLDRMTDESRDDASGQPLFCLLFTLWALRAKEFMARCRVPKESQADDVSLAVAKCIQNERPTNSVRCVGKAMNILEEVLVPKSFDDLISMGEKKEEEARATVASSKNLLRQSSQQRDIVTLHLEKLKELQIDFGQGRWSTEGYVALDSTLEQSLDYDVKLFSWLVRTFPYPALQSHLSDEPQINEFTGEDKRVPYETLVSLYNRMPSSDLVLGDFACIVIRVRELYAAARKWQEDISSFTMLTMRGGKRRETADDPDSTTIIDLDMVTELCSNPVLSKVAMPREKGIRTMLQSTKRFEVELCDLLDKDYDGESPDRVSIPEGGSLVGEDGTFHLYRLTGSPLFQALKRSIESISHVANDVLGNTPGKAAFEWIHNAFAWVDSIQSKVVIRGSSLGPTRLGIPGVEARKLLARADEIFLYLPEDLRKTLSQHKIFIAVTKEGKFTVRSLKGGAHHAVGATIIRWCPFLYNGLKLDVANLEAWELEVARLSRDYLAIRKYAEGKQVSDPVVLERSFGCREDLAQLLAVGSELVVLPAQSLGDSIQTLHNNISVFLSNHASREAMKRFVYSRYVDGGAVAESRKLLLDSLLERRSEIGGKINVDSVDDVSNQSHFRNACRTILASALKRGMATLVVPELSTAIGHCEIKAWEIENALFDRYQGDFGDLQISPEYRERARALRRSFEDPENLILCAKALCGKTSPEVLVRMPSDKLANPAMQRDRERAASAARQSVVLTEPSSASDNNLASKTKSTLSSRSTLVNHNPEKKLPIKDSAAAPAPVASMLKRSQYQSSGNSNDGSLPKKTEIIVKEPDKPSIDRIPISKFGDLLRTASKAKRAPPPPPPSLASLSMESRAETVSSNDRHAVTNVRGGDEFYFTVAEGTRSFFANLHAENDLQHNGLLPESLAEKGRLTRDNFSKFFSEKLKNGRWNVISLRLDPITEKDAREHKLFCKDYEGVKKRIVMFVLDEKTKAFLVTPGFHSDARGLTFRESLRSYVVILKKN